MSTYIHSGAKNRRSGTTMQKWPRRGELRRREMVRIVHAGYPWDGQFTSREQIEKYLDGDEVNCLLCGNAFKMLAPHIKRTHGMHTADYKERFGIPQSTGLAGVSNREANSAAAKLNNNARFVMDTKPWLAPRKGSRPLPKWLREEHNRHLLNYDGPITRHGGIPKYHDFTWHLETAAAVRACRKVKPPEGHATWSGFKKRRQTDPELNALYKAARRAWTMTGLDILTKKSASYET